LPLPSLIPSFTVVQVIKNKPAYYNQALMEIQILRTLNEKYDPNNEHHLLRMVESFNCKGHLCLVFELVGAHPHCSPDGCSANEAERKMGWMLIQDDSSIVGLHCV